jgi:hypothetical protein
VGQQFLGVTKLRPLQGANRDQVRRRFNIVKKSVVKKVPGKNFGVQFQLGIVQCFPHSLRAPSRRSTCHECDGYTNRLRIFTAALLTLASLARITGFQANKRIDSRFSKRFAVPLCGLPAASIM